MALSYTLKSNNQAFAGDGFLGFNQGGIDYLFFGWTSIGGATDTFYSSINKGTTFIQGPALYQSAHTVSSAIKNDILYVVGGDPIAPNNSSYKFENGVWSQISANCGINNRILGQLVEHNGDFYYVGGQVDPTLAGGIFNTVLKSTDNCATFTTIDADTKPNFYGGLLWGGVVSYKNLLWKICGGIYDNSGSIRTYDTQVFSSPDGITWTLRGMFKGIGRHYHQSIVYNNRIYIFNGFNSYYGENLNDVWSMGFSNNKVDWKYEGVSPWGTRHALTIWKSEDSLLMFGGSANPGNIEKRECWEIN